MNISKNRNIYLLASGLTSMDFKKLRGLFDGYTVVRLSYKDRDENLVVRQGNPQLFDGLMKTISEIETDDIAFQQWKHNALNMLMTRTYKEQVNPSRTYPEGVKKTTFGIMPLELLLADLGKINFQGSLKGIQTQSVMVSRFAELGLNPALSNVNLTPEDEAYLREEFSKPNIRLDPSMSAQDILIKLVRTGRIDFLNVDIENFIPKKDDELWEALTYRGGELYPVKRLVHENILRCGTRSTFTQDYTFSETHKEVELHALKGALRLEHMFNDDVTRTHHGENDRCNCPATRLFYFQIGDVMIYSYFCEEHFREANIDTLGLDENPFYYPGKDNSPKPLSFQKAIEDNRLSAIQSIRISGRVFPSKVTTFKYLTRAGVQPKIIRPVYLGNVAHRELYSKQIETLKGSFHDF